METGIKIGIFLLAGFACSVSAAKRKPTGRIFGAEIEPKGTVLQLLHLVHLPFSTSSLDDETLNSLFDQPNPEALEHLPAGIRELLTDGEKPQTPDFKIPKFSAAPPVANRTILDRNGETANRSVIVTGNDAFVTPTQKPTTLVDASGRELRAQMPVITTEPARDAVAEENRNYWIRISRKWISLNRSQKEALAIDDLPLARRLDILMAKRPEQMPDDLSELAKLPWRQNSAQGKQLAEDFVVTLEPWGPEIKHILPIEGVDYYHETLDVLLRALLIERDLGDPSAPERAENRASYHQNFSDAGRDLREIVTGLNDLLALELASRNRVGPLKPNDEFGTVAYKEGIYDKGLVRMKDFDFFEVRLQLEGPRSETARYERILSETNARAMALIRGRIRTLVQQPDTYRRMREHQPAALTRILKQSRMKVVDEYAGTVVHRFPPAIDRACDFAAAARQTARSAGPLPLAVSAVGLIGSGFYLGKNWLGTESADRQKSRIEETSGKYVSQLSDEDLIRAFSNAIKSDRNPIRERMKELGLSESHLNSKQAIAKLRERDPRAANLLISSIMLDYTLTATGEPRYKNHEEAVNRFFRSLRRRRD